MRFAFLSPNDGAETARVDADGADTARADAADTVDADPRDDLAPPLDAAPDGADDSREGLALYEEYLSDLEKVPTLRDPVLPDASGQELDLEEKIRAVVRDELAKMQLDESEQDAKRHSARARKRRKR